MFKRKATAQQRRLKQSFLEAIQFLKKAQFKNKTLKHNLFESPWHLFFGENKSGVSTLLGNAEVTYTLARKKTFISQHDDPNWWVSKSAVLLDIPSSYFDEKQPLLKTLIKLLRTKSHNKRINSLNLVVKLNDILEKDEQALCGFTKELAKKIQLITKAFSYKIPLYLIINQCDLTPGFKAFFNHSTKEERQQAFGVTLTKTTSSDIQDELRDELSQMTNKLTKQVVWRLYHEPENLKRLLIKDFPKEFLKQQEKLLSFVELLFSNSKKEIALSGIYFTSASQNLLSEAAYQSKDKSLSLHIYSQQKPFFIHDLITKVISPTKIKKQRLRKSYLIYFLSGLFLFGAVTLFLINFAHDEKQVGEAEIAIEKYGFLQTEKNAPLKQNLDNLAKIDNIADQFKPSGFWQALTPDAAQDRRLQKQLKTIYKQTEQKLVIPAMVQSLELLLKNYNSLDPALLYRTLRTYLSLNEQSHLNKAYTINTMKMLWKNIKNKPQMLAALANALNNLQPLRINKQLVSHVRSALTALPKPALGFVILSSNFTNNLLTLNLTNDKNANTIFTFKNAKIGISNLYTLATLRSLTKKDFEKAATDALNGNWILNQKTQGSSPIKTLTKQLEKIYLKNYADNWLAFINNIKLRQFKSISELSRALSALSTPNSPLAQFFVLVEKNITQQALNASPRLAKLVSHFNQSYQLINTHLATLNTYINNANTPKSAFNQSKQRLLNEGVNDPITNLMTFSRSLPNPLGYWVYQLGKNAWQLMLASSHQYINQAWVNLVYNTYKNQIKDRYPFSPYAEKDVSLNSFVNFFSSTGVMDQFFKNYLQDFVNTDKPTWRSIALDGLQLNLANTSLALFQKAAIIRQLFFPMGDQSLFIPFTLQAASFSNDLSSATFQLGKQTANFTPSNHQATGFKWPDNSNKLLLHVIFTDSKGDQEKMGINSTWAIWRLLQDANLTAIPKQTKHWQGSIANNGHIFKFILTTKQTDNPFSLSVFKGFHLSGSL